MPRIPNQRAPIEILRFARRIERQCSPRGLGIPDWAVCDAVLNGIRRRPAAGGGLVLFERTYPGPEPATLRVLGRVRGRTCVALRLQPPAPPRQKNWDAAGFLNRSYPK